MRSKRNILPTLSILDIITILFILSLSPTALFASSPFADRAYLGIIPQTATSIRLEGKNCHGITIDSIMPASPAEKAGLKIGDRIIQLDDVNYCHDDIEPLTHKRQLVPNFLQYLNQKKPGDKILLVVYRKEIKESLFLDNNRLDLQFDHQEQFSSYLHKLPDWSRLNREYLSQSQTLTKTITLEKIRFANYEKKMPNQPATIQTKYALVPKMVVKLAQHYQTQQPTKDLLARLRSLNEQGDFFRRQAFTQVHRNPLLLGQQSEIIFERLLDDKTKFVDQRWHELAVDLLDINPLRVSKYREQALAQYVEKNGTNRPIKLLRDYLMAIAWLRQQACQKLTKTEIKFFFDHYAGLMQAFTHSIYLQKDNTPSRLEHNLTLLELAKKIDMAALLAGSHIAQIFYQQHFLDDLKIDLISNGYRLNDEIVYQSSTDFGQILIGGSEDNFYAFTADSSPALLIDLGGNDHYGNSFGAAAIDRPLAIIVDIHGDDSYESTQAMADASAILGISMLADLSGDDSYLASDGAQGFALLGVSLLFDKGGNDRYLARSYAQGAAMMGMAALIDLSGNDYYYSQLYSQSAAIAGSVSLLFDLSGNDNYFAKGLADSSTNTPGIFRAFSQASASGFRGYASGGIAILYDGQGQDSMEAGNFSQGGGYYFGWGLLKADGQQDDTYIGSRYAMGYAAHYASGSFIEVGGNDSYRARFGVICGTAWDLSAAWFEDRGGQDSYQAHSFSHAAAAHNSLAVVLEHEGPDRYHPTPGSKMIARANDNSYHGGSSLALYFQQGSQNQIATNGNYGYVLTYRHRPSDLLSLDFRLLSPDTKNQ